MAGIMAHGSPLEENLDPTEAVKHQNPGSFSEWQESSVEEDREGVYHVVIPEVKTVAEMPKASNRRFCSLSRIDLSCESAIQFLVYLVQGCQFGRGVSII